MAERSSVMRGCALTMGCLGLLAVGGTVAVCGGLFAAGAGMNSGPLGLDPIDASWTVSSAEGSGGAAVAIRTALETRCQPMSNGVEVLFQHAWYNAITSGYQFTVWVQNDDYDSYALYTWSNKVFLRDETSAGGYVNRVLVCDLDAAGWRALTVP